ncbi:MAG TPA: ABC transporter permease [Acidimicrobiales bacterium]
MIAAWRAEFQKMATVKGQWISAILCAMAIPVFSFLVVATGGLGPGETSTTGAVTGSIAGLLAFGVWAAAITAGEYAQGTMVTSLSTVPRRSRLFAAKLSAIAAAATVGALVSVIVAFLVTLGVRAHGSYGLGNPALMVGVLIAVIAVAVIGTTVGLLTRSPTASIVIVVAALLLPKLAANLLGGLQPWVVGASPSQVISEVAGGLRLPDNQTFPAGPWLAALTMVLVAVAVAVAGALAFARRDG